MRSQQRRLIAGRLALGFEAPGQVWERFEYSIVDGGKDQGEEEELCEL